MNNKNKLLVAGSILLFLFVVLITLSFTQSSKNLSIEVAPDSADLTLDGKKISSGDISVSVGSHTIKASMAGFGTVTKKVDVSTKIVSVALLLDPTTQEGLDFLKSHPKEQLHRESIGGKNTEDRAREIAKKTPLIKYLPFIDREFRIDYGASANNRADTTASAIYVTYYSASGKQQAIDWIKFKGFDPNLLELFYIDGNIPPDVGGD